MKAATPNHLSHNGKIYLLSEMPEEVKSSFTDLEKKIWEARQEGPIGEGTKLSREFTAWDRVSLSEMILGCTPCPRADQFALSLLYFWDNYGYAQLSGTEISLALALCVPGELELPSVETVEIDYQGKAFSLAAEGNILRNYMAYRKFFDRKIQNLLSGYEL